MLKVGKLDNKLLSEAVISKIKCKRPEVLVHAGVGEDCATIDFGQYECVMSTDPITASVRDIGRLCIHISANDIASNGIEPIGIMLAVMLPVGTTEDDIKHIMGQAAEAAAECNIEIIGGHTEITRAVNRPVIVSTAVGRGLARQSASARAMKPGDAIIMTKTAGIEGTGIIARDYENELAPVLSQDEQEHAKKLLSNVSVVKEGIIAGRLGTHGMHDITEGGLLGAIWEMCNIAGQGALIDKQKIPTDPISEKICDHFGIDILRLISSGSMLIIAEPEKKDRIITEISSAGISATEIGKIVSLEEGLYIMDGQTRCEIEPPRPDELFKVVRE